MVTHAPHGGAAFTAARASPFARLLDVATHSGDDPDELLRKRLQIGMAALSVPAVGSWGMLLHAFDRLDAALFAYGYVATTLAMIALLAITRQISWFRWAHTMLVFTIPVAAHFYLGGFVASGATLLWALISTVAGMMIQSVTRYVTVTGVMIAAVASAAMEIAWGPSERALTSTQASIFFAFNTCGFASFVYFSTRHFVSRLQVERANSERLLLNVLPRAIAERLKRDPSVIADRFESVTVLFSDLVGFTKLSQQLSAREVVELLNDVFTTFDQLAELHGLEKIKTIGDAYMVVGGLPTPIDDHAVRVARMALGMCDAIERLARKHNFGVDVSMRIGVHSGEVVAGVIGRKKFSYDLWGDTVNTASRMESHGAPGKIQISDATAALLRATNEFVVEERGAIDVKGKGPMRTCWLTRGDAGPSGPA